jgi:hypothetical protein
MKRGRFYVGLFSALMILLVAASSSEAGLFRRVFAEPVRSQAAAPVSHPAITPASTPTVAPAVNPPILPVSNPVVVPASDPVASPAAGNYYYSAPCLPSSSSGWSNMPRSSWDFGKFPPY